MLGVRRIRFLEWYLHTLVKDGLSLFIRNAAGGISDLEDIEGTVEKFTNLLPAYKEELLNAN